MMIIDLNLLPPEKKKNLNRLIQFLFVKNILEFTIITTALIATILLWGWLTLIDDFNNLTESALLIGRDYSIYNQEIRRTNKTIREINEASADNFPLLPKLLQIAATLPDNIKLNVLAIDRGTQRFILSGTAKSRTDLLNYQETLKNIGWLEPAIMPATQFLQKENINFDYQTQLKNFPPLRELKPLAVPKTISNDEE